MSSLPMSWRSAADAHVLDASLRQVELARNRRGVDRHPIGMVLGVGVFRDEVPEDHQHAMVGLAQLGDLGRAVLVERAHRVAGDDEDAAPDDDVEPAARRYVHPRRCREEHGVVPRHQDHEQHAPKRRQRRVPASVEVRRAERRQGVEAEQHPLAVDCQVHQQADSEQRQEQPELLVHFLDAAEPRFHDCRAPGWGPSKSKLVLDEGRQPWRAGKNSAAWRRIPSTNWCLKSLLAAGLAGMGWRQAGGMLQIGTIP